MSLQKPTNERPLQIQFRLSVKKKCLPYKLCDSLGYLTLDHGRASKNAFTSSWGFECNSRSNLWRFNRFFDLFPEDLHIHGLIVECESPFVNRQLHHLG